MYLLASSPSGHLGAASYTRTHQVFEKFEAGAIICLTLIVAPSCLEGGAAGSLVADGRAHRWHNSFGLAVRSGSLTAGIYGSALFTRVSRAILGTDRLRRTSYTNTQAVRIPCPIVATRSSLLSSFL
jgi:hypothetical protein